MSIRPYEGYIFKIGTLVVFQKCVVDGSSNGVQENLRNRLEPLIEMQVGGDAC